VGPHLKERNRRQHSDTYIADDRKLSERVKYFEPYSDVLTSLSDRPTRLTGELVGVEADLNPVVEQRE